MLPRELLIFRYQGDSVIPKRLPLDKKFLTLAQQHIDCFQSCVGQPQKELEEKLALLEGNSPEYRIKRGLNHLLKNHFSRFEIVSPIKPSYLRQLVFRLASQQPPTASSRQQVIESVAHFLSKELNRQVLPKEIEDGLYADLEENRILIEFSPPSPETLIHRYNLSQVQGIFYRASHITLHAYRNDPGEYKLLFRYIKFFQLMSYVEGDADTGFTITIDGPASLFNPSTRYGLALAKMIPALLHVSKWQLTASIHHKDKTKKTERVFQFYLDNNCGLVSHYPKNQTYDSLIEESFANQWKKLNTPWRLEREVELIPIPPGVMIPDFRIVHPDGRYFLLEIIGYWHPQYLQKKFYQIRRASQKNLLIAVSERLNLDKAGIKSEELLPQIIWFKNQLSPMQVLDRIRELEGVQG